MVAPGTAQVEIPTPTEVQLRILQDTAARLAYFAVHPDEIDQRLMELEEEWDLTRALDAAGAGLTLWGLLAGATGKRTWSLASLVFPAFIVQYAVTGWSPAVPVLRYMGFRKRREIDEERYALKAIRGDFDAVREARGPEHTQQILECVRR